MLDDYEMMMTMMRMYRYLAKDENDNPLIYDYNDDEN